MSRRIRDLTGQRFGRLLALRLDSMVSGHAHWECRCDCGKTVVVMMRSLVAGKTQSCGCLKREKAAENIRRIPRKPPADGSNKYRCSKLDDTGAWVPYQSVYSSFCAAYNRANRERAVAPEGTYRVERLFQGEWVVSTGASKGDHRKARSVRDFTGQRFGRWTVVRLVGRINKTTCWECRCDCGTVRVVSLYDIVNGRSKSCGCILREKAAENLKNVRKKDAAQAGAHGVTKPAPFSAFHFGKTAEKPRPAPKKPAAAKAAAARKAPAKAATPQPTPAKQPLVKDSEVDLLFNLIHGTGTDSKPCSAC